VTTIGHLQLGQDSDPTSRANIPRGELTEIRRCKPRRCPLLVRPLPTRCSQPVASDLSHSPRMANRVRQTGNFRTIGRRVRRGVERRCRCDEGHVILSRHGLVFRRIYLHKEDPMRWLVRSRKAEGRSRYRILIRCQLLEGKRCENRTAFSRGDSHLVVNTARALPPASLLLPAIRCPGR
jgi:hypothetical protein